MARANPIEADDTPIFDSITDGWDRIWAGYSARYAADLIDLLYPQQGETALDLAGGTGAAALKLAERLGPGGKVTVVDISSRMLERASENAAARGLANIDLRRMAAESLDFPSASFDLITCNFGVQSFGDVPKALRECHRVLKPGGRMGFTVWSDPGRTPFFSVPAGAALQHLSPIPIRWLLKVPGMKASVLKRVLSRPGRFGLAPARFSRAGSLERQLSAADLVPYRRDLRAFPISFPTFDHYWKALLEGTPAKVTIEKLDPRARGEVREEVYRTIELLPDKSIQLHNEAALIFAKKPA